MTPSEATKIKRCTPAAYAEQHAGKNVRTTQTARRASAGQVQAAGSQVDRMFRAFCDRTRLRILSLLREGELCVGNIVRALELPQPKVSRHLSILRKAGLVSVCKEGLWCHYSLVPARTEFHRKLLECAATCLQEVPEIQADRARAAEIRKSGGCCPQKQA